MASVIEQEAQAEWEAHRDQLHRKHAVYKINTNILVGTMKYRLLEIILEEDPQKQATAYGRLITTLTRYIVPRIEGRSFVRKKGRENEQVLPVETPLPVAPEGTPSQQPIRASV